MTGGAPGADPADFRVDVQIGRTTLLTVGGDVDVASSDRFEAAVDRALEDRPDEVLVDLAAVTFADSTGLRSLLLLRSRCAARGIELRLRNLSAPVAKLLELAGVTDEFDVV